MTSSSSFLGNATVALQPAKNRARLAPFWTPHMHNFELTRGRPRRAQSWAEMQCNNSVDRKGIIGYKLHDATCKHCSLLQLVWTIGKICKMIRSGSGLRMGPRPTCHLLKAPEKPERLGVSTALAVPSVCQPPRSPCLFAPRGVSSSGPKLPATD